VATKEQKERAAKLIEEEKKKRAKRFDEITDGAYDSLIEFLSGSKKEPEPEEKEKKKPKKVPVVNKEKAKKFKSGWPK